MFNEDGTITFEMPSRNGSTDREVTLRRPRVEELFVLWEEIDRITAAAEKIKTRKPRGRPKAAAAVSGDAAADEAPAPRGATVIEAMKQNLRWTRLAVATLGPEGLYAEGDGTFHLADEKFDEPSWFVNGTIAVEWLRHWQTAPLDLGG